MGNKKEKITRRTLDSLTAPADTELLISDLRQMIDEARSTVAVTVNVQLTFLYWRVGMRISKETLKGNRAEYGKQIIATVSQQLSEHYMVQPFYEQMLENKREILFISQTRDTLLPKLISGELPIPDADKLLEVIE